MQKLVWISVFLIMLVALLANPAPVSIEMADLILIAFPSLMGVICLAATKNYKIQQPEYNLLIAILLYLSYLLISILVGLINGVPILNVLRSIGPYINFFPLLLISLLPIRVLKPWSMALILIIVGGLQASYHIYLYFIHSAGVNDTLSVLRGRITLIEPRTTLPIVLSITILPMVLLDYKKNSLKLFAYFLILLGVFAGAATLTRSIMLSIIVGWLTFLVLYLRMQLHYRSVSMSHLLIKFSIYTILFCAMAGILSLIPKIYTLEQGLLARFYYYSSLTTSADYSNGRIYDEWMPAIAAWINSGALSIVFGIGAGNTFLVATGEERTYIHNLLIYSLVYGGLYGLFASLWLYLTIFKVLVTRAFQANQIIYLGFAALLISIFFYGQLFAVHKGLAFNAMLFLIITLALSQPTKEI